MIEQKEILISDIYPNKDNVRSENEDLHELMASIKKHGLLQPIGIQKQNGKYIIIFGHRRYFACKKLGFEKINCNIFAGLSEQDILIFNTLENVQQKTITPLELGKSIQKLKKTGLSFKEMAIRLSITESKLRNAFALYIQIPKKFQKKVNYNIKQKLGIGMTNLSVISRLSHKYKMDKKQTGDLIDVAEKNNLTSRQISAIPFILQKENTTPLKAIKKTLEYDTITMDIYIDKNELKTLQQLHNKTRDEIVANIIMGKLEISKTKMFVKHHGFGGK